MVYVFHSGMEHSILLQTQTVARLVHLPQLETKHYQSRIRVRKAELPPLCTIFSCNWVPHYLKPNIHEVNCISCSNWTLAQTLNVDNVDDFFQEPNRIFDFLGDFGRSNDFFYDFMCNYLGYAIFNSVY